MSSLTVHRRDAATAVELHSYWTPSRLLIAARDLCLLGHAAVLGDGCLALFARSVQFEGSGGGGAGCGEGQTTGAVRADYTRAQLHCGGFLVQALHEGRTLPLDAAAEFDAAVERLSGATECRVTFVAHLDLRGHLPAPLRAKLLQRQPLQIRHLPAILERERRQRRGTEGEERRYAEELRVSTALPPFSCPVPPPPPSHCCPLCCCVSRGLVPLAP